VRGSGETFGSNAMEHCDALAPVPHTFAGPPRPGVQLPQDRKGWKPQLPPDPAPSTLPMRPQPPVQVAHTLNGRSVWSDGKVLREGDKA
jgi:hypothetical protein